MGKTREELVRKLTKGELEILLWLSNSKRNMDIAAIMEVSTNIIDQRVHVIKNKLGAGTTTGAVAIALRTGVIK